MFFLNITAGPIIISPCRDSVATRFAVIAYPYLIKANSATVKKEKKAVSRLSDDTLQQDYMADLLELIGNIVVARH